MADKDKEGKTAASMDSEAAGETDEITRYQGILARESSSLVFAALAEAYRKRRMPDQAIAVCRKGLQQHPDFVSGRVALARAYVDKGETDRAAKELERVVLIAPDNLIAQRLLLHIYEEKHDGDNLERTVHRILSLNPRDEQARKSWERMRSHPAADAQPENPRPKSGDIVTRTLAEIYASQGHHDRAFEIFRKLSLQEPENSIVHERIADLKQKIVQRGARAK